MQYVLLRHSMCSMCSMVFYGMCYMQTNPELRYNTSTALSALVSLPFYQCLSTSNRMKTQHSVNL
jgi:hypothetical protein